MATKSRKHQPKKKPLSDADRHKRFLDMAKEVGAADDAKAFDNAFRAVAKPKSRK